MAQQPQQPHPKNETQAKPEAKPETPAPPAVKIVQVAQQGSQLVALLSDGSLWAWAGVSWQSIPLPPPAVKPDH